MTRQEQTNGLTAMSVLSLTNPAGWSGCSALFILIVLLPEAASDAPNATSLANGGGSQCGEYTNQVIPTECAPQIHHLHAHLQGAHADALIPW